MTDTTVELHISPDEATRLRMEINQWQTRHRNLSNEYEAFRTRVRDAIIGYAKDQGLCTEGTNEFLTDLGLDPIEQKFKVTWKETYTVTIERTGYVDADSEESAVELVEDDPEQYADDDGTDDLLLAEIRYGHVDSPDDCEDFSAEVDE